MHKPNRTTKQPLAIQEPEFPTKEPIITDEPDSNTKEPSPATLESGIKNRELTLQLVAENKVMLYAKEYFMALICSWLLCQDADERQRLKEFLIFNIGNVPIDGGLCCEVGVTFHKTHKRRDSSPTGDRNVTLVQVSPPPYLPPDHEAERKQEHSSMW